VAEAAVVPSPDAIRHVVPKAFVVLAPGHEPTRELAIAILALLGVGLRLILPMVPAGFLLLVTLVPAAPQLGLSGWVVGVVCSVVAFTWLLPRQYEVLRMVREATDGELFTDRQAIAVGAAMTGVALIAIAVSVPYWRAIGIL